jgi:glycyl-tRNA synthetase alpha chain
MEVSQFTYFQQVGGIECKPGFRRADLRAGALAMYVQGVDNVYDLNFNGREGRGQGHLRRRLPAGRAGVFAPQFRVADTEMLFRHFEDAEGRMPRASWKPARRPTNGGACTIMVLPAYDQCIKASTSSTCWMPAA